MNKNHLAIVKMVLMHITETYDEWTGPADIHEIATKKFDFDISLQEVTEMLRQMLIRHFVQYDIENLFKGYERDAFFDLQRVFPGIDSGESFRSFPWDQIGYTQLQQVHNILEIYGAPDLFYENPEVRP